MLTPMVTMNNPQDLNTTIELAKRAESGYQFNHPYLNQNTTTTNAASEAINKLTQQIEQISLNYANISNSLNKQNEPRENKRYNRNKNFQRKGRTDKRNIVCYKCGNKGHYARECLSEKNNNQSNSNSKRKDANYLETSDYYDEPGNSGTIPEHGEVYGIEPSSESGKERKLLKRNKPEEKHTTKISAQVDKITPYNVVDDILNVQVSANIGQMLQYPNQRRNLTKALRPSTTESNYANSNKERKTSAVRCRVRIKGNPVIAVLDSGAAVSIITNKLMKKIGLKIKDSSNVFVVTANGTKTRALGKIPDLQIALQTLAVPITLQVIESSEDTLLLGTDWFHKTNANLNFGTNTIKLQYEDKVVTIPITHHVDEDPKCIAFEDDDNISQEKYEEEYEDESYDEEEINYSDHAIETDEEYYSEDIALDYNPWTNEIKFEERPAASLAHAEVYNSNEWNVKDDLHVGPLNYHQQSLFQTLISESADICAASQTDIGRTNIIQHEIHLKDDQPIASHPYRSNPTNKEFLKTEISNMEERGLIKKSKSPWASPVVIVDKKTGNKRICIDYRKLNANTKTNAFPLSRIDDLLDSYRNANW